MVDDFKIPGDPGYGYDSYRKRKELSIEYIKPLLIKHKLKSFFPVASSAHETGDKRGCILITSNRELRKKLNDNDYLYICTEY